LLNIKRRNRTDPVAIQDSPTDPIPASLFGCGFVVHLKNGIVAKGVEMEPSLLIRP
jgi:hypothetical protein